MSYLRRGAYFIHSFSFISWFICNKLIFLHSFLQDTISKKVCTFTLEYLYDLNFVKILVSDLYHNCVTSEFGFNLINPRVLSRE